MGPKHLRLNQKIPPVPVDRKLCSPRYGLRWRCRTPLISSQPHSNALGKPHYGHSCLTSPSNRATHRLTAQAKALLQTRKFDHQSNVEIHHQSRSLPDLHPRCHSLQRSWPLRCSLIHWRKRLEWLNRQTLLHLFQRVRAAASLQWNQCKEAQELRG